ncbi:hypothetical protein GobsT_36950 [Gemmata obscuriglobus]|uniref:Uncharacterized protein n=1 Tax=Gemmata obscuriglobus TaxID=114 RepID=A0A2Z3H1I3_9BACT|nr:hypothetical protein [Gemmata obscuriglobus]AWM38192.1 hypothetical protein C1280_15170 [Gemmata obscuriglobus]QEG28907.1 hypothetical protein GobsT_36950 [Gemmata obscuriglobus]VTS07385.1 unnamed protein product [Gemmata obscuriglobus UQM 2246]
MNTLLVAVLVLAIAGGALIDVRLALWVWAAWSDHRAERRASDLVPHLERAHRQLRDQNKRLRELEAQAAQVQQHLWGTNQN